MAQQDIRALQASVQAALEDIKALRNENKELKDQITLNPPKKEIATQEAKIPTYEGTKDARSAEAWFAKAESIAKQNDWTAARFIETATSQLTKEAEEWVVYLKDQQAMFMDSTILTDQAAFKAAFIQQFSKTKSIAGQAQTLLNMKQGKDETVNAYWVRVQNYFNKIVKEYTEAKKLTPDKATNNIDYQKMSFLAEFMRDQMITKYFVGCLLYTSPSPRD